jgi:hypothetical protein
MAAELSEQEKTRLAEMQKGAERWIKDERPVATSNNYKIGLKRYRECCAENGFDTPVNHPAMVVVCMKKLRDEGYSESTINNSMLSAVNDEFKYSADGSPTQHRLVIDAKRIVAQTTPAPKRRTEFKRSEFSELLQSMHKAMTSTAAPLEKFQISRDVLMFLFVYKVLARPEAVTRIRVEQVTEQGINRDGQDGISEDCEEADETEETVLQVVLVDGKTNKGGPPHVALIANGADDLFSALQWYRLYTAFEKEMRGPRLRPNAFFYGVSRGKFGDPLAPSTINSRLKKHLKRPELIGLSAHGLTVYSFRVAGVSQAIRAGVDPRLVRLHGNWKSAVVERYICDEADARLAVSDAL